jgi:hypothetical protein
MPTTTLAPFADRLYRIPLTGSGHAQSMKTLWYVHAIVRGARENPVVREQALAILRSAGTPEKSKPAAMLAIHAWVQRHMRYVHDPDGVEWVTLPTVLLDEIAQTGEAAGDCDDLVTLEQSLLQAVGVQTQSVILKADPAHPREWSHIYLEAHDGRRWVPLDPIMKDKPAGWQPPTFFARRAMPVGDGPTFPPADGRLAGDVRVVPVRGGLGMVRDQWHPTPVQTSGDLGWAREAGNLTAQFSGYG